MVGRLCMGSSDELVDHVDAANNVISVVTRATIRRDNLLHRSVGILVVNSRREVLIHRRADDKDVWPGQWDLAAGGVVASGETYELAAARELAEEVGIVGAPLEHLTDGRFVDDRVNALVRFFRATWDGPVHFDDGEVVEALWVSVAELRRRLDHDVFVPDSRKVAEEFLDDV
jgi:isopentenyldiphosphate isomerase